MTPPEVVAASFQYAVRGSLVIFVGGAAPPDDQGWEDYVAAIGRTGEAHAEVRIAIFSEGGSPSPLQRRAIVSRLSRLRHRAAVVSNSMVARAFVTVFEWLGSSIRAFSAGEVERACDFLMSTQQERDWLIEQYRLLSAELGRRTA